MEPPPDVDLLAEHTANGTRAALVEKMRAHLLTAWDETRLRLARELGVAIARNATAEGGRFVCATLTVRTDVEDVLQMQRPGAFAPARLSDRQRTAEALFHALWPGVVTDALLAVVGQRLPGARVDTESELWHGNRVGERLGERLLRQERRRRLGQSDGGGGGGGCLGSAGAVVVPLLVPRGLAAELVRNATVMLALDSVAEAAAFAAHHGAHAQYADAVRGVVGYDSLLASAAPSETAALVTSVLLEVAKNTLECRPVGAAHPLVRARRFLTYGRTGVVLWPSCWGGPHGSPAPPPLPGAAHRLP
jgi:hypothetical protein